MLLHRTVIDFCVLCKSAIIVILVPLGKVFLFSDPQLLSWFSLCLWLSEIRILHGQVCECVCTYVCMHMCVWVCVCVLGIFPVWCCLNFLDLWLLSVIDWFWKVLSHYYFKYLFCSMLFHFIYSNYAYYNLLSCSTILGRMYTILNYFFSLNFSLGNIYLFLSSLILF